MKGKFVIAQTVHPALSLKRQDTTSPIATRVKVLYPWTEIREATPDRSFAKNSALDHQRLGVAKSRMIFGMSADLVGDPIAPSESSSNEAQRLGQSTHDPTHWSTQ